MRKKYVLLSLLLSGCFSGGNSSLGDDGVSQHVIPVFKQKQKIALLQRKLMIAEKGQTKAEEEVARLNKELCRAQLALIDRQIESFEKQMQKARGSPLGIQSLVGEGSTLFLQEREILHEMMQQGPSPSAFEAQVVLDRILQMITDLRNVDNQTL